MLKIIGAKGNIQSIDSFLKKIEGFAKENNLTVQAFNADLIYGKNHLISSVEHATRSIVQKTNTTNSLGKEILLYASGGRQLKIAIPKMGVKQGKANIAFVFYGDKISDQIIKNLLEKLSLAKDNKVLEGSINTLKKYGISNNELESVTKDKYGDLILEKIAMVDIIK